MSKPMETQAGKDRLIYDPETDAVHVLNPTAQAILRAAREGLAPGDIAQHLRSEFDLAADHPLEAEVETMLAKLRELNLI